MREQPETIDLLHSCVTVFTANFLLQNPVMRAADDDA
jgi:hypothetical protein